MSVIFITICSLVILLGFEIRYREIAEELLGLFNKINKLDEEIVRLKAEIRMKKNIYEEHKPA